MSWTSLKNGIATVIKTNGNQEITGNALQGVLNSMVNALGAHATFAGFAIPSTSPGTPDGPVFYLALQAGSYPNFGATPFVVSEGEFGIFAWNGTIWITAKYTPGVDLSEIVSKVNTLDPKIGKIFPVELFEIGGITATTNGWTYSANTKRARTKNGVVLNLSKGDRVGLSDYTGFRYYLGMRSDGVYTVDGWRTSDYTMTQDAEVVLTIARRGTESNLVDVNEAASLFFYAKRDNLSDRMSAVENNVAQIFENGFGFVPLENATFVKGYINKNDEYRWTDVSSTSRQHLAVPVKSNSLVVIRANDENAAIICALRGYSVESGVLADVAEYKMVSKGTVWRYRVPEGVTHIYMQANSGALNYVPSYISVTDDYVTAIEKASEETGKVIDTLRDDVFGFEINGTDLPFEIGHVTITDSGWTLGINSKRVRINKNSPLELHQGDIMSLTSYDNYKYYVGWRSNGTYGQYAKWLSRDFVCPIDGEYMVLIARRSNETDLANVEELSQLFTITRPSIADKSESGGDERVVAKMRSIMSIAHQGYTTTTSSTGCNLAEGYIMAAEKGFDYGECDLQFSSDGVPFCCHPTKINNVWENAFYDPVAGEYVYFAQNTAEQIKAHAFIDEGQTVSTFDEVVSACKSVGLGLILDKTENIQTQAQWDAVYSILKKHFMMDKAIWAVWEKTVAVSILEYYPSARITFYNAHGISTTISYANSVKTPYNDISLDLSAPSIASLESAYESLSPGIGIVVYTINDKATYKEYIPYVSGIISDSFSEMML